VLRASAEEFLRHGYEGATIARIMTIAGGSTATVYRDFGGKAGLFTEAVQQNRGELEAALEACDLMGHNIEDGLFLFGKVYVAAILSPKVAAYFRMVIAESARFPELKAPMMAGTNATLDKLAIFLQDQNDRHRLGIANTREAAVMFAALLRGRFYLTSFNLDAVISSSAVENYILSAVTFFLRAYGINKPPSALGGSHDHQGRADHLPQLRGLLPDPGDAGGRPPGEGRRRSGGQAVRRLYLSQGTGAGRPAHHARAAPPQSEAPP
jgi:AcrR family transcriptional regulator